MTIPLLGVLVAVSGAIARSGAAQDSTPPPPDDAAQTGGIAADEAPNAAQRVILNAIDPLVSEHAPDEERARAARTLVGSDDPLAVDTVIEALERDAPFAPLLVSAVRESEPAPAHLVTPLIELLDAPTAAARTHAVHALSRWCTKPVVGALIERLLNEPLPTPEEQRRITQRLRERLALPPGAGPATDEPRAWRAWFKEASQHDDEAWAHAVLERHRTLARERGRQLEETTRTLRDAYRRLYALLPEDERTPFIAELLLSPRLGVRELGHEIAQQALLNARTLGPEVRRAALQGAVETDPALRRRSAGLLERLGLGELPETEVFAWLNQEPDGATAAALMRLVARQPSLHSREVVRPVLRWLSNEDDTTEAALEAALALHHAGLLDEEETTTLADSAERALAARPTPLRVRTVDAVGDVTLVLPLLSEGGELTLAAARALADNPEHLDALIEAARSGDRLFPIVAEAMCEHRPSASSLATLLTLPASTADAKREAAASLVTAMPPRDQLEAIASVVSPADRAAYLAHAADEAFHRVGDESGATRRDLALALARAHLELREPRSALSALDAVPDDRRTAQTAGARTHALLWLGRIDEARSLQESRADVPPEAWLNGLRDAIDLAHAGDIADAATALYAGSMTEAQHARLDALRTRLAATDDPAPSPAVVEPTG